MDAGLYLFSKGFVAALLVYLLLKHESRRILWSILSIVFFAFVFILPVFTNQRNLQNEVGWMIFWVELVIMIIIPVILLMVNLIMNRRIKRDLPDLYDKPNQ